MKNLSPEIKNFFSQCPACTSMDPRLRVTQGIIAWMVYSDEKTQQYREISKHKYFEKTEKNEEAEYAAWEKEHEQVSIWFQREYPSFKHAEQTEEFHQVQARKKARKMEADKSEQPIDELAPTEMMVDKVVAATA